jgi:hypothetical protein
MISACPSANEPAAMVRLVMNCAGREVGAKVTRVEVIARSP